MSRTEKVKCNICYEWMQADHGPNKTPWHIRKGGIMKCAGSFDLPVDIKGFEKVEK